MDLSDSLATAEIALGHLISAEAGLSSAAKIMSVLKSNVVSQALLAL